MNAKRCFSTCLLCLLGCGILPAQPASQPQLASANIGFAFRLIKELAKDQPGSNVFISPYSASTVLQMVANGAGGRTRLEMQAVLGISGLPADAVNAAALNCSRSLNGRGAGLELTTANAVWYRQGLIVKPEFTGCNRAFFGATIAGLDFSDPHSVDIINAWAKEKTRGRIDHIADGLVNGATEICLANAVYFKGNWETPFDVKLTKDRKFFLTDGRQERVPMMEQSREFAYRRGTGYQAVRLAYQGAPVMMYIFLPDAGSDPRKLLGIMGGDTWQRVTEPGFIGRPGTLVMPRFQVEYDLDLKPPLVALGMRTAFDPRQADFSGIADHSLFISAARQKAFGKVNEEGTEAAAVTAITFEASGPTESPFQMVVDRPFLWLIEDQPTRTILFMGLEYDPGALIR